MGEKIKLMKISGFWQSRKNFKFQCRHLFFSCKIFNPKFPYLLGYWAGGPSLESGHHRWYIYNIFSNIILKRSDSSSSSISLKSRNWFHRDHVIHGLRMLTHPWVKRCWASTMNNTRWRKSHGKKRLNI